MIPFHGRPHRGLRGKPPPREGKARERGVALVATLFLSVAVALLAATFFAISFLDGWMAANHAAGEQAFYAAEAGVEHALASIPPAPDFTNELSWPSTGPPLPPIVEFPRAPVSYRVTAVAAALDRIELRSVGTAARGSRREIEGILCRESRPATLAALVLGASAVVGTIAGVVDLDGGDLDGVLSPRPALGIEDETDSAGAVGLDPERRLLPLGSGFPAARARLADSADRTESGPFTDAVFGGPAAPAVVRLTTSAEVSGTSSANGILVADAPLRIHGRLEVEGLLLASAGIEVRGELRVHGAAHVEGSIDVAPGGHLGVAVASHALEVADDLRPGVLPRSAILCGVRELW